MLLGRRSQDGLRAMTAWSILWLASLIISPSARASEDDVVRRAAAARAFEAGQHAQLSGRYREAAEKYELADSIIPSAEALKSAVRCYVNSGSLTKAATLANTLNLRCDSEDCRALARSVLDRAQTQLVRLTGSCNRPCILAVNGAPVTTNAAAEHQLYLKPGTYEIEGIFEGEHVVKEVRSGRAGEAVSVSLSHTYPDAISLAPAAPPTPRPDAAFTVAEPQAPPSTETGLHPVIPIVGFGIAAALGGTAAWSYADTQAAHDDYVAQPTPDAWDDGRARQNRTNILLWTSIATAAVSAVSLLFTDF